MRKGMAAWRGHPALVLARHCVGETPTRRKGGTPSPREPQSKGLTLIEMVTAIAFVTVLAVIAAPLFASMFRTATRGMSAVETDRTLDHMLERLRRDVQGARAITVDADANAGDVLGILRGRTGVFYNVLDGKVARLSGRSGGDEEDTSWRIPDARVEFRAWPGEGEPRAVEVRTCILEHVGRGLTRPKLSRTHLIFLAGVEGRAEP